MGRRAARKGNSKKPEEIETEKTSAEETDQNEEEEEEEEIGYGGFFACYLLTSLSPRHKGHCYIGFTVNPRRRIRQHNGEMRSGAWRTKRGRPWEMILCIYGFPSNVSALQFEWHWQHPIESLSVRKAASNFKSLSGIANKIKLAYTMLNLPSWENLNITVNFFSTKYMKHIGGCPKLPKQMRVNICDMDELPCYVEGQLVDDDNYNESDNEQIKEDSNLSTTSNALANRVEEVAFPLEKESPRVPKSPNFKESTSNEAASITHSCSGEEQASDSNRLRLSSHSPSPSKSPSNDVSIGCLPMSPEFIQKRLSFCIEVEGLRQKSPPTCSFNVKRSMDNQMLFSRDNVVDLETPPSCIVGKRNKRAKLCTKVIDLTDSPFVIEL